MPSHRWVLILMSMSMLTFALYRIIQGIFPSGACILVTHGVYCLQPPFLISHHGLEDLMLKNARTFLMDDFPLSLPDFALEANGEGIYASLTTSDAAPGLRPSSQASTAAMTIRNSREIGSRWCFASSAGQIGLHLSTPVFPSNITIDHIPKAISVNPWIRLERWSCGESSMAL